MGGRKKIKEKRKIKMRKEKEGEKMKKILKKDFEY